MKKKRRNPIHAYKHLLAKDYDWDYAYLVALEKKKLQRMHDYFKTSDITEDNKYTTRDLGICLKLIDIFMENDGVYSTWLERAYSGTRIRCPARPVVITLKPTLGKYNYDLHFPT